MSVLLQEVVEIVDMMLSRRVRRLELDTPTLPALVIELDPSAWEQKTVAVPDGVVTSKVQGQAHTGSTGEFCACGHDLYVEHNEAGCLHGCSHDLCRKTEPKEESES